MEVRESWSVCTFDLDWRCITAGLHYAPEEDGNVCYIAALEYWGRLILRQSAGAIEMSPCKQISIVVRAQVTSISEPTYLGHVECKVSERTDGVHKEG